MSIKPKLSSLVNKQLPEFIRDDYQAFAAFIQAYYEFLEQTNQADITQYRDIDDTLDSFVEQFRKELAPNLPNILSDKRFVLQNIKDQYLSKGTEASYRLLFRLLFDKEITIDYPSRQLLRASDGRWKQDYSIFVEVSRGDPENILGKVIQVITPEKNVDVRVDNYRWATITKYGVSQTSDTIVELFIDKKYFGNIEYDYIVQYGADFEGVILPTTASVEIITPGQKFSVGDLHYVKSASGEGSLIKITRISPNGGVLNAQFIKFGLNYGSDFTTTIPPLSYTGQDLPIEITSSPSGSGTNYHISISDTIDTIIETGLVNQFDYAVDLGTYWKSSTAYTSGSYVFYGNKLYQVIVSGTSGSTPPSHSSGSASNGTMTLLYVRTYGAVWDGGYCGALLREFHIDNSVYLTTLENLSQIKVNLGSVAKYPGYYSDNLGFLDDAIYIQDGNYYQAYSYVIKIDERLDSYKNAVKSMIHPAGMALFGEYELRNEFDIGVTLESILKFSRYAYKEKLYATDQPYLTTGKSFSDTNTVADAIIKLFNKAATDETITASDSTPLKLIGKLLDELTTVDDSSTLTTGKNFTESFITTELVSLVTTKTLTETPTATDSISLATSFVKSYAETLSVADQAILLLQLSSFVDSITVVDSTTLTTGKNFTESVNVAEVPVFNIGTVLSETYGASEQISLATSFVRTLLDTVTVTDTDPELGWYVSLTDQVYLTDSTSLLVGKLITDTILSADTIQSFFVSMGLSDSASAIEQIANQINKNLTDAFTATDEDPEVLDVFLLADSVGATDALGSINVGTSLSDNFSIVDAIANIVTTKLLSDSVTTLDDQTKSMVQTLLDTVSVDELLTVFKLLDDYFSMTDSASLATTKQLLETPSVADLVSYLLSMQQTDSPVVSEQNYLNISKPSMSDSSTAVDSGYVQLNPYMVAGYLDTVTYVGTTSTF